MAKQNKEKREFDSRNFVAELIGSGFTIIPGESGDRDEYGYVNSTIMRYCIKSMPSGGIVGRYLENREIEGKPRFEIVYDLNDSWHMKSAVHLKKFLKKLEVEFTETPSVEEREKKLQESREMASALEESLK